MEAINIKDLIAVIDKSFFEENGYYGYIREYVKVLH